MTVCGLISAAAADAQVGTPVDDAAAATPTADRPLPVSPSEYGQWENLGFGALSPDGEWLAVGISRVNEEDELRIRRIGTDSVLVVPYGGSPRYSEDGRWLAYSIGVSEAEREKLEKAKKPVESALGLLDLVAGDTARIEGVSSFAFSDDGRWLAMRRYPAASAEGEDEHGADLVVRDLRTATDVNFGNVGEFAWQDDGQLLAMTVDAADNAGNGVRLYDPARASIRTLESRAADYTRLAWRDDAADLAVLRVIRAEDEDDEDDITAHAVVAWRGVDREPRAYTFDPADRGDFPSDLRIVEHRTPQFSDDGSALFLGVQTVETEEAKEAEDDDQDEESESQDGEDDEEDEEEAGVEVWHSRDPEIIPRQKVTAGSDRRENHLVVWHLVENRFVRLGTAAVPDVRRIEGDRLAYGVAEAPYDQERMFGPSYADIYLIDTRTGERRKVIERVEYAFGASPAGKYLLYLRDDAYHVYDIGRDRHVNITGGVATDFVDLEDDHTVDQKPPFRYAGWTEDDRSILIYDEYDVWEVRPDGSGGDRRTAGREDSVIHRYARVDWDEDQDAIRRDDPAYYSLTGEWTKRNGYAVASRLDRRPERRLWLDASVSRLNRADDADVFAYAVESFDDSPDYFVARGGLREGQQVTRTNPFQSDYAWGRSELIDFHNTRGQRLQGALFYPAGWEPGKLYPMITYIYEIRSPSVHSYYIPSERSAYNTAVWTSQGYFVFQPDILYRDRNPGLSAVEALVPAVEAVVATGLVDPERIGLVGHSWGGYQTAFVPTQTDIFAAAVAGAPLTELTSMYLSIYWNSGGTDARIFEISQGRMEVPPWEDWESYNANSPVHHIESLDTPMLVAFGDEDGAVDWDQGTIFYNAARRAGKEMVLLVYEGENHGLRQEANQKDYHRRINQWFAHYLKGEPAPAWMKTGVPFLEQEKGEAAPRPVVTEQPAGG